MGQEFANVMQSLQADNNTKAIILTGTGKGFSAGGDLSWLKERTETSPAENSVIMRSFYELYLNNLIFSSKPLIAAVNGPAVGAGACLSLGCDIRIASDKARFGFNFVNLGIPPGMGSSYTLPMLIGHQAAARLLLTGEIVSAQEAKDLGLVLEVVDHDKLEDRSLDLARKIASASSDAVKATLKSIRMNFTNGALDRVLQREADTQAICFSGDDIKEGLAAVMEKRTPDEPDYESILESLDSAIRETELELSEIAPNRRRMATLVLVYGIPTYLASLAYYYIDQPDVWHEFLAMFGVMFGMPMMHRLADLVECLAELKSKQQLKVEELKKKTSYYLTKGLIERYETPTKSKSGKDQNSVPQPAPLVSQQPPTRPRSQTDTVRQRIPVQNGPNSSNGQIASNGPIAHMAPVPNMSLPNQVPVTRTWIDKVVDSILGSEEGPQNRYALICEACFTHNGLVPREDYSFARFKCMSCGHMNIKNPSALQSIRGINVNSVPQTPVRRRSIDSAAETNSNGEAPMEPVKEESGIDNAPLEADEEKEEPAGIPEEPSDILLK